ncbi:hypothetical protein GNI_039410 [Gregarina niphandrodes]|uniref:Uncharacterized protein n=1 Tax=Gregarina niphandrodes TaxID=110365 RepID=A0A023BAG8_GRENI|nr:hypothetical protein GNI_039410 [Gregarina niphandrodes]EZG78238.1 hypothetical protein GNI_039410 [Gregarina niphandrodes]|eukprot:XP_011129388.1 hypothetical protein GNI_039410 [Gregarina niphandrodes]
MIWVPVTEAKKIMADVRSSDNRKHSSDVRSFDDRGKEEAAISLAAAPNKAPVALAKTPIATIPSPTVQSALPLPAPAAIPLPAPEAIPLPAPAAIPLPISGGLLDASSPAVLATSTSGATVLATSLAEDEEDDEDDVPFFISARAADLDAGLFHNFISSIGDFSEDATEDYEAASGDGDSLLVPLMILEGPPDLAEAAVVLQEELNHDGEDSETKSAAADFIAADLMKSEEAENAPAPASPTQTPVLRLRRSNGLVASLLRPRR